MNLSEEFPMKVCLNLEKRDDRRRTASETFRMHRLGVDRWKSFDGSLSRHPGGFATPSRRAKNLSFLRVIRHARLIKAKAVLIFEDDVELHPCFGELVEAIDLPEDWGLFYFGCLHAETPVRVTSNVVRIVRAHDTHAVAVRDRYFGTVMRGLRPEACHGTRPYVQASDMLLANLQNEIPSYAAYPNLAWQRNGFSDLTGETYSHYSDSGEQIFEQEILNGV